LDTTWKILSLEAIDDSGDYDIRPYKDKYGEWTYRYAVIREVDGFIVDLLATDGGEPEDNTLTRDWAWIADALNDAYNRGIEEGERREIFRQMKENMA